MSWDIYNVGKFTPVEVAIRYDRVSKAVLEWTCPRCHRRLQWLTEDDVKIDQLERWASGAKGNIQDVLEDVPAEIREVFLSGICPECWDKMFKH